MNLCDGCQSLQADNAKFCNGCGKQLLSTIPSEPQRFEGQATPAQQAALRKASEVILGFFVLSCLVCGGCFFFDTPSGSSTNTASVKTAINSSQDDRQLLRIEYANQVSYTVKEQGCEDCGAVARGTSLVITFPHASPIKTATEFLGSDIIRARLKELGFVSLKVRQDTKMFAPEFDYPIK